MMAAWPSIACYVCVCKDDQDANLSLMTYAYSNMETGHVLGTSPLVLPFFVLYKVTEQPMAPRRQATTA